MQFILPKLKSIEPGLCRIYYRIGKALICFQEDRREHFSSYSCTRDGEPIEEIQLPGNIIDWMPVPQERRSIVDRFRNWIEKERELINAKTQDRNNWGLNG